MSFATLLFATFSFRLRPLHLRELKKNPNDFKKDPTCIVSLSVGSILNERKSDISHEFLRLLSVVSVYLELPALYLLVRRTCVLLRRHWSP